MSRVIVHMIVSAALLLLMLPRADAKTWRVEKDGTGDFTVIQAAVNVAAVGDTILIGPGRFSDFSSVTTPGWTEDVFVNVMVDSLTLIGTGNEMTVIGPALEPTRSSTLAEPLPRPKGILGWTINHGSIMDIGFDSTYWLHEHIYWSDASIRVANCKFTSSGRGLALWGQGDSYIYGCEFLDMNSMGGINDIGIAIWDSGSRIDIVNCMFLHCTNGVLVSGSSNVNIADCSIRTGNYVSVKFQMDSDNCRVTNTHLSSAVIKQSSTVVMDTCTFVAPSALSITNNSTFHGTNLILPGNTNYTIEASSSSVTINDSHIFNAGGASVTLYNYPDDPPAFLDLTRNYWGTSSSDSIAAWIHDGHDDPEIRAFVDYEPFEDAPISAEEKSFGDVKRMFR